ncbi:MAG: MBL fold metallo-hydrolase [Arachnia sp.]
MLIQPIPVSPWQANCYVVLPREGATECLIVDPGLTGAEPIRAALADLGVAPVALLATHGHVDHIGDAHLLAAEFGVPLYLAAADQHLVTRPGDGLGPQGTALMRQLTGTDVAPGVEDLRDYDGALELAGLTIEPFPVPGHTAGSTLLTVSAEGVAVTFTGDVLFAGTIGRTDLPGGSMSAMRESLRRIARSLPADRALLPGHGAPTTMADELATNPFLQPEHL